MAKPARARSRRWLRWLLPAASLVALTSHLMAGCAQKSPTEVVLSIESDMKLPKDFNVVRLLISSNGQVVLHKAYPVINGTVQLPATIGIAASNPDAPPAFDVKLYAYHDDHPETADDPARLHDFSTQTELVLRHSRLSFTKDRTVLLRMPVHFACIGLGDKSCNPSGGDDLGCNQGACQNVAVDASGLHSYQAVDVFGGPQPLGGGSNGPCFDGDGCLATMTPLTLTDPTHCVFSLPSTLDPNNLTVALRHSQPQKYGFCQGTTCRVPVDFDVDQSTGWWFPDASHTTVQLPPGLCSRMSDKFILGVDAGDVCGTKAASVPLCGTQGVPTCNSGQTLVSAAWTIDGGTDPNACTTYRAPGLSLTLSRAGTPIYQKTFDCTAFKGTAACIVNGTYDVTFTFVDATGAARSTAASSPRTLNGEPLLLNSNYTKASFLP